MYRNCHLKISLAYTTGPCSLLIWSPSPHLKKSIRKFSSERKAIKNFLLITCWKFSSKLSSYEESWNLRHFKMFFFFFLFFTSFRLLSTVWWVSGGKRFQLCYRMCILRKASLTQSSSRMKQEAMKIKLEISSLSNRSKFLMNIYDE